MTEFIPIPLKRRTDKERADYLHDRLVELMGEKAQLEAELLAVSTELELWRKRARKWKRRAKAAEAKAETTVTGGDTKDMVTGSGVTSEKLAVWNGDVWKVIDAMPVVIKQFPNGRYEYLDNDLTYFNDCPRCGGIRGVQENGDIRCGECGR